MKIRLEKATRMNNIMYGESAGIRYADGHREHNPASPGFGGITWMLNHGYFISADDLAVMIEGLRNGRAIGSQTCAEALAILCEEEGE